jgi:hypothetical protein
MCKNIDGRIRSFLNYSQNVNVSRLNIKKPFLTSTDVTSDKYIQKVTSNLVFDIPGLYFFMKKLGDVKPLLNN